MRKNWPAEANENYNNALNFITGIPDDIWIICLSGKPYNWYGIQITLYGFEYIEFYVCFVDVDVNSIQPSFELWMEDHYEQYICFGDGSSLECFVGEEIHPLYR